MNPDRNRMTELDDQPSGESDPVHVHDQKKIALDVHEQKEEVHQKTRVSSTLKTPGNWLSFQADLFSLEDFSLKTHIDRKRSAIRHNGPDRHEKSEEVLDFKTDARKTDLHAQAQEDLQESIFESKEKEQEKKQEQEPAETEAIKETVQEEIFIPESDSDSNSNSASDSPAKTKPDVAAGAKTSLNPSPNTPSNPVLSTVEPDRKAAGSDSDFSMTDSSSIPAKTEFAFSQSPDHKAAANPASDFESAETSFNDSPWTVQEKEALEAAVIFENDLKASQLSEEAAKEILQQKVSNPADQPDTDPNPDSDSRTASCQRESALDSPESKAAANQPLHSNTFDSSKADDLLKTQAGPASDHPVGAPVCARRRFFQILKTVRKYNALQKMTPVKLRMILEDLGPTYVKLGQIMSSRSDLLPPAYTKELEKLRSNVAPMPYATVRQEIIRAYGKTPEELFASFSQTPLGSASMAQVHEAITKEGQKVVVKVQRPGIYEQMKVDVAMLKKAGKILSLSEVVRDLVDVEEVIDEFWTSAQEEMDFRHEAGNAIRFAKECQGLQYIHVPKIYTEYTRPNILVMEEVGGVEIDNYPELAKLGYSRHEIAMRLGMNFLSQVIDYGFFHADPHSGNLKIDDGRICWLDFGMMGEISKNESAAISQALHALAARDTSALTDAVLAIGIPPADLDYIGFSNALESYLNRYVSQDFASLDLGKMIEEAVEVCNEYKIRLPKGISMLARSMVTIQGTLKDLDPEVNMLNYISKSKTSIDQIDWNQEIVKWLQMAYADGKALMNLPLKADNILGLLSRGQLRLGLSIANLQSELMPEVNRWVDRIIVCVLIAALLVGSSIICTTNMKPRFLEIPLLGFVGFFLSFCLSLWLFYKMIFHAKKGNKLF